LKTGEKIRKVIYPLLDKALKDGDVVSILSSINLLTKSQLGQFSALLEKVELSEVILFSEQIADKQQFLDLLDKITYSDISAYVKERSQLHKIVEKHLWLFGEQYTNVPPLFSDKNLSNILNELRKKYFTFEKEPNGENFTGFDDKKIMDITDLFFLQ
jgi:hypothetical protein